MPQMYTNKKTCSYSLKKILLQAIKAGEIKMDFKGFAMGDSWISPVDSTNSWGPYLYATVSFMY